MEYGSTILYRKWIVDASLNRDVSEQERLFRQAGFNGCIGSTDATHIGMLSCASWAQIMHKVFKLNIPSQTYNMTVDHCCRILGTTGVHPSTWNGKTIILHDELACGVKEGKIHAAFEFMLYERDEKDHIV